MIFPLLPLLGRYLVSKIGRRWIDTLSKYPSFSFVVSRLGFGQAGRSRSLYHGWGAGAC